MFSSKTTLKLGALVTSVLLGLASAPLQAESQCKGLEKRDCENRDSCSWVDSYTRKDGVKVSGHCRTKGGKK